MPVVVKRHHNSGELAKNARLNETLVLEIRRMAKSGMRHDRIANYFGIPKGTIVGVIMRRTWKHIDEEDLGNPDVA